MKITRKGFFTTIIGAFAGIFAAKKVSELNKLKKLDALVKSTFYKYDNLVLKNYKGIKIDRIYVDELGQNDEIWERKL